MLIHDMRNGNSDVVDQPPPPPSPNPCGPPLFVGWPKLLPKNSYCDQGCFRATSHQDNALRVKEESVGSAVEMENIPDPDLFWGWFKFPTTSEGLKTKNRYLMLTIINLDPNVYLQFEKEWFDTGRFWSQPFEPVEYQKPIHFQVCNRDFAVAGVSGGVGFSIYKRDTTEKAHKLMLACTFSNPLLGQIKGRCGLSSSIRNVWDNMDDDGMIREDNYGMFRWTDCGIVFFWKPKNQLWSNIMKAFNNTCQLQQQQN